MSKQVRRMMRMLRYHPLRISQRAHWYENCRIRLSGRKLVRWIKRYRHRLLSMLGECHGKSCPNSRKLYPHLRAELVHTAMNQLHTAWGRSWDSMTCIFWGSGSLLQEIMTLTELCQHFDVKNIHVVLCDIEYEAHASDERIILDARFEQALSWMLQIMPHVNFSWQITCKLNIDALPIQRTLFFAADIEVTSELLEAMHEVSRINPMISALLDNHGEVKVSSQLVTLL